jgi:hypothetical protein
MNTKEHESRSPEVRISPQKTFVFIGAHSWLEVKAAEMC